MVRMKNLWTLPLMAFVMVLASCGVHDSSEKYFLVSNNIQIPYWQAAAAGFNQAAGVLGVHVEVVGPSKYDVKGEVEAFRDAVNRKASGILVSVADPKLLQDDIDKAIAAGIPVVTIDADAPASKRLFFIGTNNYQAGLIGGRRLVEELKGKGNVVVFTISEQSNLAERLRGYRDAIANHPDIKITQVVDIQGDPLVAFDTMTTIVHIKSPRVDAVVCLEALAGKEIAAVLNNEHVKDRVVIAMDTDADVMDWIKKGGIAATIAQKPFTMAYVGLMALDDLHHHKLASLDADWSKNSFSPIPAYVDTGSALIDKSNLDAFFQQEKKSATSGGQ